jgi:hypothetical protein
MKQFEDLGEFWLPGAEQRKQPGTLKVSESMEIELSLLSPLESFDDFVRAMNNHPGYPIVFGTLRSGKKVTINGALCTSLALRTGTTTAAPMDFKCSEIYGAAHLAEGSATKFHSFHFSFDYLSRWAKSGAIVDTSIDDSARSVWTENVPPPIVFGAFGGTISIGTDRENSTGTTQFSITHNRVIEFIPESPITFGEFKHDVVIPLQYFLTFAMGGATHLNQVSGEIEGLGHQYGAIWIPESIDIGYVGWHQISDKRGPVPMRLPLVAIESRMPSIIGAWTQLFAIQERAMSLFFTISLGLDQYVESQFLLAVQSAELFHRRKYPVPSVEIEAHRAWISTMLSPIENEEEITWLNEKLNFSHEPTLKQRLSQLLEFAGPELTNYIRPRFVKIVGDTRNFLTHYDARLALVAAAGEDLWRLTQETMALVEYCLFRELGFSSTETFELCKGLGRYMHLYNFYNSTEINSAVVEKNRTG